MENKEVCRQACFHFKIKSYYTSATQFATVPELSLFWRHSADPRSVPTTTGSSNRRRAGGPAGLFRRGVNRALVSLYSKSLRYARSPMSADTSNNTYRRIYTVTLAQSLLAN